MSIAGPLTNIFIAILASVIAHLIFPQLLFNELSAINFLGTFLYYVIFINLALGIFNLVPIPPLDGSRLMALILPKKQAETYLSLGNRGFGLIILVVLFYVLGFGTILSSLITGALRLLDFNYQGYKMTFLLSRP